jgi:hypothetical protein
MPLEVYALSDNWRKPTTRVRISPGLLTTKEEKHIGKTIRMGKQKMDGIISDKTSEKRAEMLRVPNNIEFDEASPEQKKKRLDLAMPQLP